MKIKIKNNNNKIFLIFH